MSEAPKLSSPLAVQETNPRTRYGWLAILFFLHGMALSTWFVPLATILDAYQLRTIKPWAFATWTVSALVSPLLFGAMADRRLGPVRVLRGLAFGGAVAVTAAATAIRAGANPWLILGCIQFLALCSSPTWSLSSTIVLSALRTKA